MRIDAPGFRGQCATKPRQAGRAGALGAAALGGPAGTAQDAAAAPALAVTEIDGTFRILTDGEILANNTDEGPQAGAGGKILQWRLTKRTQATPLSLVRLAP